MATQKKTIISILRIIYENIKQHRVTFFCFILRNVFSLEHSDFSLLRKQTFMADDKNIAIIKREKKWLKDNKTRPMENHLLDTIVKKEITTKYFHGTDSEEGNFEE